MRGANRAAAYLLGIALCLASTLSSASQSENSDPPRPLDLSTWPCAKDFLATAGKSNPVAYRDSDQILKSIASYRTLQIPCCYGDLNIAGEVKVEVLIDPAGRLRCARAISGNPLAMQSAIQSLPTWHFKPYRMRGRRTTVIGYVLLPFHFLAR